MRKLTTLVVVATLGLLLPACSSDLTQLVVVVDSDLDIPVQIDTVRVDVLGPSGGSASEQQASSSSADLPLTLSVRPAGSALGPIHVAAVGLLGGVEVVRQTARVTLVSGETRMLRMRLSADCVGVACSADQTCASGACGDVPTTTEPWPGHPPTRDAAVTIDGGSDGGPDGGPDAGDCSTDTDCDDGLGCTVDRCAAGVCVNAPDDPA
ncbi:MAG: hypothetical protein GW913_09890, partial [Myxococcales bacterium]|nr:hypothetical protein [Myxococcales bacterium]